jgi:hypothetical protein
MSNFVKNTYLFYLDGFKSMTVGKTLWMIILIKLFVMFFILKLFFFRSELAPYKTSDQKSRHVIEQLTQ